MWVLGLSAIGGNLAVLILRIVEKPDKDIQEKQRVFISSLAMSDSLMGVYMVILAIADLYYGDQYFKYSDQWRTGLVCKVVGFLGLLSSEASVFFITLISIDRYLSVVYPFSQVKLRAYSSKVCVIILWFIGIVISIVPILLAGPESDFYDLSDVCMGLPLITRPSSFSFQSTGVGNQVNFEFPVAQESKPAWIFSIGLFLCVNLMCFVVIFMCYVAIFVTIKQSGKSVGRKESMDKEIKMAVKMAAVVGTDFLCWCPVIIMGILSQTGLVVIPLDAYVWSVVFILPVNSSLNPYLYTIANFISDRKSRKQTKKGYQTKPNKRATKINEK